MADCDVVVVGAGLAGLVAAVEAADAGKSVILLDQEGASSFGGQAWWALGGIFLVDSPEQRRLGIKDSAELARHDWLGSAGFDRPEDHWPRQWADAFVQWSAGDARALLKELDVGIFPIVNWAERGGYLVGAHGNSVPRFHVVWGTGPGILTPFVRRILEHVHDGRVQIRHRHRMTDLITSDGRVGGVTGEVLEPTSAGRGEPTSRVVTGDFRIESGAVVLATGGIGGNPDLVRQYWPGGWGPAPQEMLAGVPDSTDGHALGVAQRAGANLINLDRSWHYPEGVVNHAPVWTRHGVRVLAGPSVLWLDATGTRLPPPLFPGFDSLGAMRAITASGRAHSWFVTDMQTLGPEFSLSGSEQNPDITGKSVRLLISNRAGGKLQKPVRAFLDHGVDFLTAPTVPELVAKMNELTGEPLLDADSLQQTVEMRDAQVRAELGKDAQVLAVAAARRFVGDRLMRTAEPHAMLDPQAGPLVAVRLHILTRKTLGGLENDLSARVLRAGGEPLPGLFAAGEVAGFGGGGMHGYRSLEGTFLGACLFGGRIAGREAAASV